ncbi:MAG: hypothetical protein ACQEP6_01750 [Patescibacteria group bacterium]
MKDKRIVKSVTVILAIVFTVLVTMCIADYRRTLYTFEKPIFAQVVNGADDGGSGSYVGIGYSIDIKGNFMPEDEFKGVTHASFYVFGKKIHSTIRD